MTNKFSPEVRARVVQMVTEREAEHPSRWAPVSSIAEKIGCAALMLNEWVKKAGANSGELPPHFDRTVGISRKAQAQA